MSEGGKKAAIDLLWSFLAWAVVKWWAAVIVTFAVITTLRLMDVVVGIGVVR